MQFSVNASQIQQAQFPHNLFVSGLFLFDLSLTPAVIVMKLGMVGLLLPLICSGALLAYIYLRSQKNSTWFVAAHWRLSFKHARWLLLGYGISALLIFVAWLISQSAHEASMQHILWTALTRIALMPTLIAVMVTAVMEASAIGLASKGEVPDKIVSAFPPN